MSERKTEAVEANFNPYLVMFTRMEPDIAATGNGAFDASSAISLKRIADSMDELPFIFERVAVALESFKVRRVGDIVMADTMPADSLPTEEQIERAWRQWKSTGGIMFQHVPAEEMRTIFMAGVRTNFPKQEPMPDDDQIEALALFEVFPSLRSFHLLEQEWVSGIMIQYYIDGFKRGYANGH